MHVTRAEASLHEPNDACLSWDINNKCMRICYCNEHVMCLHCMLMDNEPEVYRDILAKRILHNLVTFSCFGSEPWRCMDTQSSCTHFLFNINSRMVGISKKFVLLMSYILWSSFVFYLPKLCDDQLFYNFVCGTCLFWSSKLRSYQLSVHRVSLLFGLWLPARSLEKPDQAYPV